MSSSDSPSKRERQKQRREAKLAQQREAESRARRNRILAFIALGLVFIGLVAWAAIDQINERNAIQAEKDAAVAKLDELGCTEDTTMEDAGQGHLDNQQLATSPPDVLYPDRPATSGQHFANWFITGVYDQQLDERILVHDMEHGYVVAYYDEDALDNQVANLKEYAQAQIDGDFKKIIVARWDGKLEGDANFAFTAWNQRQMCEDYDDTVFGAFIKEHHSGQGEAPEKSLPAHLAEDSGIDPGDEPFLLPPLGDAATPRGDASEDPTVVEPTEGTS